MTRKDFVLIAETIRYMSEHCDNQDETDMIDWAAEKFADALATTNAQFDRKRFLDACTPRSLRGNPMTLKAIAAH